LSNPVTSAAEFAQRAGEAMLGAAGPRMLASVVVLSVLASILALLIMAPRLYVAMSSDHIFPSVVAAVNPRNGAPARATVLLAAIATLFVAIGTFEQIVAFFMCTTLTFIALAAAALLVVRRKPAPDAAFAFRVPRFAPALFILLVAGVVILVALNRPVQALAGAAVVLLGAPAYRAFTRATGSGV
jgi:APA family basic amino acid/polyamine antiporter